MPAHNPSSDLEAALLGAIDRHGLPDDGTDGWLSLCLNILRDQLQKTAAETQPTACQARLGGIRAALCEFMSAQEFAHELALACDRPTRPLAIDASLTDFICVNRTRFDFPRDDDTKTLASLRGYWAEWRKGVAKARPAPLQYRDYMDGTNARHAEMETLISRAKNLPTLRRNPAWHDNKAEGLAWGVLKREAGQPLFDTPFRWVGPEDSGLPELPAFDGAYVLMPNGHLVEYDAAQPDIFSVLGPVLCDRSLILSGVVDRIADEDSKLSQLLPYVESPFLKNTHDNRYFLERDPLQSTETARK